MLFYPSHWIPFSSISCRFLNEINTVKESGREG
uniref:Uncharacterized protein n=1 Tax=Nelumbo nucifera TaxID=4432 RepID=A0A822ZAY5_NELNU|nr:TPA_asm: hypothetical protein HUJ06_000512 [Nelumbo nucifera]